MVRRWLLPSKDDKKPLFVHVTDATIVLPSTAVESGYASVVVGKSGNVSSG